MARQKKQDQPTTAVADQPAAAAEQAAPAVPAPEVSAQQEVEEILAAPAALPVVLNTDPDSMLLSEDQIATEHFENPRGAIEDTAVMEMVKSLQQSGQLQSVVVAPMLTSGVYSGKFPLCAGWTRTEAFRRMVYGPLIKKFNDDNGLKSTDTGFLLFANQKHRDIVSKVYPDELAKNREKFKIRVFVKKDVTTEAEAFVASVSENTIRNDMPLLNQVAAAETAIVKYNIRPRDIAIAWKCTDAVISQQRKVNRLLPTLREKLVTPDPGEQMSESDIVKLTEDVKTLTNELERRMKLNPRAERASSFSHLREFAYRVVLKDGEEPRLTRVQIMDFLCALVGADPKTRKLMASGDAPHQNYTLFVKEMAAAEELNKKQKELAAQPQAVAPADGTTPTPAVAADGTAIPAGTTPAQEQAQTGTVEELAKAQASGAAEAAALNTGAVVAPAPAPAGTPAPAQSSVATALSMSAEELEHVDTDSPLPEGEIEDNTPAGQKKAKTGAAPVQQFNIKTPDRIHKIGLEQAQLALQDQDEEQVLNSFWTAAVAGSAATAFEVLGMDEKYKRWNDAILKYVESMEVYPGELEQFAKTAGAKAGLKPPQGLVRPRFTVEGEVVDDAFAEGMDDDAELPSEELGEPSDDDLAEIEAMDIGMGDDEEDLESLQALVGKEGEVTDEV